MSKYTVVEKVWDSAGFNVTILSIPVEKINDKLAILSDGSGTLSSMAYHGFLLNTCIIDPSKIWAFLKRLEDDQDGMVKAMEELHKLILEVNPLLDARLLVISSENVIRIPEKTDIPGEVRLLVNNTGWDKPEISNDIDIDDMNKFFDDLEPPKLPFDPNPDIPWSEKLEAKEWTELEMVVLVARYSANDIPNIFKDKYSFGKDQDEAYRLFIVSRTIADFSALLKYLDESGMTEKHSASKLVQDLYNFAVEQNPFLDWDTIDLEKVKKAVIAKHGKAQKPHLNKFSKDSVKKADAKKDAIPSEEYYREFDDVTEDELSTLGDRIKHELVGQDHVVNELVDAIKLAKCGFKEEHAPIASFLLTGESGVGKTHCAKMLAKHLTGDEHNLVRVDCSEYSHSHEISKLIGSPPGYVNSTDTSKFFDMLTKSQFRVILFDELEKSHPKLSDLLLQAIDEGHLTNGKSETIHFGQSIFLFTSNIGVKEVRSISGRVGIGDVATVTLDKRKKAIDGAIKNKFKPEFIGRLDGILTFDTLKKESCVKIIDLQFERINKLLEEKEITIEYGPDVIEYLYGLGFQAGYGARPLKRVIRKEVFLPISKGLLEQKLSSKAKVVISVVDGKLSFSMVGKKIGKKSKVSG